MASPEARTFPSPFAMGPTEKADPWPIWSEMREHAPVIEIDDILWVLRYDEVRFLSREASRFSSNLRSTDPVNDPLRARMTSPQQAAYDEMNEFSDLFVVRLDGVGHDRLRRVAQRAFTPRRIADLEEKTTGYVDGILDRLAADPVADMAELAYEVPLMIIGDLLGVPTEDRLLIKDWSNQWFEFKAVADDRILKSADAARQFRAYVESRIDDHRGADPETDLIAALMGAEQEETLSSVELAAMFFVLLFAGHETTTNLIGTGLLELLRDRDQWQLLCDDPSRTGDAVEELLRFVSPVQWNSRVAVDDTELAGTPIPAGSLVIPVNASANRDPRAYPDPDALDIGRDLSTPHLAFGFGPHYCLGASLARLEATIALRAIAVRYPGAELATDELEWRGAPQLRGLAALPVHLRP